MSDKSRRSWRVTIYEETKRIVSAREYQAPSGLRVVLPCPDPASSEQVYAEAGLPEPENKHPECKVDVVEGDCLETAIRLQDIGLNPVVLNMASAVTPGGGVTKGAGAQEENLFRRSSYYLHLYNKTQVRYPICDTGAIYTPGVWVFRHAEATSYQLMETPKQFSFIALPALRRPKLVNSHETGLWLRDHDCELIRTKIRVLLKLALKHGHNSLVLSAWGCGAYCNPPRCIATLFQSELSSPPFQNAFSRIVFAIFNDHNSNKAHNPEGNLHPFAEVFGVPPIRDLNQLV